MAKAYVFPGQGAQFVGMGKDLYESNDQAKALFDYVVEVASGKQVCSEAAGFHDMAIFKQGVTL